MLGVLRTGSRLHPCCVIRTRDRRADMRLGSWPHLRWVWGSLGCGTGMGWGRRPHLVLRLVLWGLMTVRRRRHMLALLCPRPRNRRRRRAGCCGARAACWGRLPCQRLPCCASCAMRSHSTPWGRIGVDGGGNAGGARCASKLHVRGAHIPCSRGRLNGTHGARMSRWRGRYWAAWGTLRSSEVVIYHRHRWPSAACMLFPAGRCGQRSGLAAHGGGCEGGRAGRAAREACCGCMRVGHRRTLLHDRWRCCWETMHAGAAGLLG